MIQYRVPALDRVERAIREAFRSDVVDVRNVTITRSWRGEGAELRVEVGDNGGTWSLVVDTFGRSPEHGNLRAYVSPLSSHPADGVLPALREVDRAVGGALCGAIDGMLRSFSPASWWDPAETARVDMFLRANPDV